MNAIHHESLSKWMRQHGADLCIYRESHRSPTGASLRARFPSRARALAVGWHAQQLIGAPAEVRVVGRVVVAPCFRS